MDSAKFGSFLALISCELVLESIKVINNLQNLGSDYKFMILEMSDVYITSLTIQNLDWWGESMIKLHSSQLHSNDLIIENSNC